MEKEENIEQSSVRYRLRQFINHKGLSQSRFEKITKLSNGYVNNIRKSIKMETLDNNILSVFPELNKMWLLTGEGSMLKQENKARSVFEPENAEDEPTGYYYPNVNASAGLDISTLNEDIERLPMYLPLFGKGVDYINVYGDSMYPKYNAGEVIGVKETEFEYLNYGYPYVVVFNNGDVYIKYVKKGKDENHVLLESENAFYEPREFHLELIKSFYSIRGVVKKEMM